MNSSFVTNLKYAFQDKSTLFLIMDLLEGGDLQFHLRRKEKFSEWETKFYAAQIIMGLSHIHSRNMIYRDLKPANILLDGDGNARISDLGLVRDKRKGLPTSEWYVTGKESAEGPQQKQGHKKIGCFCFFFFVLSRRLHLLVLTSRPAMTAAALSDTWRPRSSRATKSMTQTQTGSAWAW